MQKNPFSPDAIDIKEDARDAKISSRNWQESRWPDIEAKSRSVNVAMRCLVTRQRKLEEALAGEIR